MVTRGIGRAWVACALITVVGGAGRASGGVVVWDESIHGDLSGNRLAPTNLSLGLGTNAVIATSVAGDLEYVHMSLPAGGAFTSIVLSGWISEDNVAFIAVQAGTVFTEPPVGTNVANLLGWTHFGPFAVPPGEDLLGPMGTGFGAIGFTPPLAGSDFVFWIQQTGPAPTTYRLDFNVVPTPGGAGLLWVAAGLGLSARRRRRTTA